MHNFLPYGTPQRVLPRPSSSGVLPDSYKDASIKRQRVNPSPPRPYTYPQNFQNQHPQPYFEQPYTSVPLSIPDTRSQQPFYPINQAYPSRSSTEKVQPIATAPTVVNEREENKRISVPETMRKADNFDLAEDYDDNDSEDDSDPLKAEAEANASEKSIVVPGTSITLTTQADIEKWRKERKKMWLLKISNNKLEHMNSMGIKECELKAQKSVLQESKKQKQFIHSIQNQVSRINPKSNLNVRIVQRELAQENFKLLQFIRELGDANILSYELTQEEKDKLFGMNEFNLRDKRGRTHNNNSYNNKDRRNINKKGSYHQR